MYNGIGLSTPRGSGTNGYVQRSAAYINRKRQDRRSEDILREAERTEALFEQEAQQGPDQEILLHEKKRAVEVKCMELQVQLEDQGDLEEEQVEERVQTLRERLLQELKEAEHRGHQYLLPQKPPSSLKAHQVHERKAAKAQELEQLNRAFRMDSTYVEGQAFDREFQEEAKRARIAAREERERERE
ncbi:MAG: hypothetical protein DHS80DRAFT_9489, partial [Piptocephalis tieghemiana]